MSKRRRRFIARASYLPRPRQHGAPPSVESASRSLPPGGVVDLDAVRLSRVRRKVPTGRNTALRPTELSERLPTTPQPSETVHLACEKCGCQWWWAVIALEGLVVTGRGTDLQCSECGHQQKT